MVQPFAADSATIGYLLTVADTSGRSRSVVTDLDGIEEFLDLLAKATIDAKTLTDAELPKPESITCMQATYKDFADAAVAAVKMMEFVPASIEGHKIEQLVQYPIDFKLNAVLPVKPFEVPV